MARVTRNPPPRHPGRRAVVTGLGAITPIGNDVATFWANLLAGVSGVGPITQFDASAEEVRIAAEVKDFEPRDWIEFKQARRMSRFAQLAVAAARQAIDDSGLEIGDQRRRLRFRRAGVHRGAAHDRARRCRRGDRRRDRVGHPAGRVRRSVQHGSAVEAES